jgi:hypothetical protein
MYLQGNPMYRLPMACDLRFFVRPGKCQIKKSKCQLADALRAVIDWVLVCQGAFHTSLN